MILSMNKWTVSGEIVGLKELDGEFGASVRIKGVAKRPELYSSQILEFLCLMTPKVYAAARKKGFTLYKRASVSGHLETWKRETESRMKQKVMFIADYVDKVE